MREPLLRHQVVGLEGCIEVIKVDANGASHEHVLGSLCDLPIALKQVGLLKSLEAKEVVIEIAREVKHLVNALVVRLDHVVDVIGQERGCPTAPISVVVKLVGCLEHACFRALVKGLDCDAIGQFRVVRVHNGHVGACFCRQISDLLCCYT